MEPWVVLTCIEDYRAAPGNRKAQFLPPDHAAVEVLLQSFAPRLFNEHIALVFHDQLRKHKQTLGKIELNRPRGVALTAPAAEWQKAIVAQIQQLAVSCGAISASPDFQSAAIQAGWATVEQQVLDPTFLSSGTYRRDLSGKRLLKLLWQHLRKKCGFPGTEVALTSDLVKAARASYAATPAHTFPDFDRLAQRLTTP